MLKMDIFKYLGYNIELKSLLTGNESVIASKIPLTYEKRNDKNIQKIVENSIKGE